MNKKKTKSVVIVLVVLASLALIGFLGFYIPLSQYTDTHTWVTIDATICQWDENADAYDTSQTQKEYLKGDSIAIAETSLKLDKITHDGTITFSVANKATITDENGTELCSDTIRLNEEKRYYTNENDYFVLKVVSNRYQ